MIQLSDLGTGMTQVAYVVEGRWPPTYDQQRKREIITVAALLGLLVVPFVVLGLGPSRR